jgi:hypothetical protein
MARRVDDSPVKTFTYWIPNEGPNKSYAWIVLDSHGRFATISDYGNYGYWWVNWGDGDFRDFVRKNLCGDGDYLVGKLGMDKGKRLRLEETKKALRAAVLEYISRAEQAEELALLGVVSNEHDLHKWCEQTVLEAPYEHFQTDFDPQVYAFAKAIMPRLKLLLDAERMAETTAAVP